MMKAMERLMVKLSSDYKSQLKNQNEPQVRNPNFRRQQIRPPFEEDLVDEEFIEEPQEHIHQFGDDLKSQTLLSLRICMTVL